MVYRDRFEINPSICGGKPVIRGSRVLVTSILTQLTAGESFEKIRHAFPGPTDEDIRSAIAFAKVPVE